MEGAAAALMFELLGKSFCLLVTWKLQFSTNVLKILSVFLICFSVILGYAPISCVRATSVSMCKPDYLSVSSRATDFLSLSYLYGMSRI